MIENPAFVGDRTQMICILGDSETMIVVTRVFLPNWEELRNVSWDLIFTHERCSWKS